MKHAGREALDGLAGVLDALRRRVELREKSRGVFHRRGRAFLHFHEDPAGVFADLRLAAGWKRMRVVTKAERAALLRETDRALA